MATNFDEVINSDDEPQIRIIDSNTNLNIDLDDQTNSYLYVVMSKFLFQFIYS
jgi:hypothetical protein